MNEFKLKTIILNNVFNYYHKNEINLESDRPGNVILFDVTNGGGKTSLFLAIKWGFYGNDSGIVYEKDQELLHNRDFLNADSLREGATSFSVEIHFTNGGNHYELSRICRNYKTDVSEIVLKENNQILSDEDAKITINRLIPPDYGDFFMFNGEMLSQIASNQKSPKKIEGVMKLLGLKQLKDLVLSLEVLKDQINSDLNKARKESKNLGESASALDDLYRAIQNYKDSIIVEESTISDLTSQKEKAEQKRADYTGVEEAVKEIEDAKQKNDLAISKCVSQEEKLKQHASELFIYFLRYDIEKILDLDKEEKNDLSRVSSFSDDQADAYSMQMDILQKHLMECPVCMSLLTEGAFEKINASIEESKEKRQRYEHNRDRIKQLKDEISLLEGVLSDFNFDYQKELDLYNSRVDEKIDAEIELKQKEDLARKSDREIVQQLSESIYSLESQIAASQRTVDDLVSKRKVVEDKYQKLFNERIAQSNVTANEQRLSKELNYVQALISDITMVIDQASRRKRDNILEKANEVFKKITNKPEVFNHLEYVDNNSFSMNIIDGQGHVVPRPSSGEKHVLAISFLVSLSLNTNSRSTMMMDTPLARLDNTHRANIGKMIASLDNQVIFLAQPTELEGETRKNLMPAVIKEYYADIKSRNRANILEVKQ